MNHEKPYILEYYTQYTINATAQNYIYIIKFGQDKSVRHCTLLQVHIHHEQYGYLFKAMRESLLKKERIVTQPLVRIGRRFSLTYLHTLFLYSLKMDGFTNGLVPFTHEANCTFPEKSSFTSGKLTHQSLLNYRFALIVFDYSNYIEN